MTELRCAKTKKLLVVVLVAVVSLPVVLIILLTSGLIVGQEFSPDDFSRRRFFYNRIPWIKFTIMGIHYENATPVLEQTLVADGLITPVINDPKIWHLVGDSHTPRESRDCDARLLCDCLDMIGHEGESVWVAWNEGHPKTAKLFWPKIAGLARDHFYLPIPELGRRALALQVDDPARFRLDADKIVAKAYFDYGSSRQQQGLHQDAVRYLTRSIDVCATGRALRLRAESYAELGDRSAAEKDLAAASNLPDP